MNKDIVLALAERLFICSQLLTCAAERLSWDSKRVRALMGELEKSLWQAVEDTESESRV